jgi:hypothetical protein
MTARRVKHEKLLDIWNAPLEGPRLRLIKPGNQYLRSLLVIGTMAIARNVQKQQANGRC